MFVVSGTAGKQERSKWLSLKKASESEGSKGLHLRSVSMSTVGQAALGTLSWLLRQDSELGGVLLFLVHVFL